MPNTFLRKTTLLLTLPTLLAACTVNPYTGEQQTRRSVQYGAIGAAVCGLIGAAESGQRARNSAAGCGLIGAGVGAYMDVQETELRQQLQGTGVQIQRNGDQLALIMPGNITFATNDYSVRPDFEPVLNSVGAVLYKYSDTRIRVIGHTDSTGSADYNYNLSNRRAASVANFLASHGLDQGRIISQGMGPDHPIADNTTPQGRAQNRRVELEIVAAGS